MPDYEGLIVTVGMSHEPVVFSIQQTAAQWVAFICTPDSEKTLDAVIAATALNPSRWRKYVISDEPRQIGRLCAEFYGAFRWLTEECGLGSEGIAADPTAGRKWMSSGATMVAAFLGLKMQYVDVIYLAGKPDPNTMKVVELGNAYDQTGFVEAEKGRVLFNEYEFATAAEVFERIRPSISERADLYQGLTELSRTLDRWDKFEHYENSLKASYDVALEKLRRHLNSVEGEYALLVDFVRESDRLAHAIEELHREKRPAIGFTVDLFCNAQRRIRQHRYDDACARLYRCLESLAQYFLKQDLGIDTSKPDWEQLTYDQRQSIQALLAPLPDKIALDHGLKVLFALNHELGTDTDVMVRQKEKLINKFAGLLEDRNSSILAHGFIPIQAKRVEAFSRRLRELLARVSPEEFEYWEGRLQAPQLPHLLS